MTNSNTSTLVPISVAPDTAPEAPQPHARAPIPAHARSKYINIAYELFEAFKSREGIIIRNEERVLLPSLKTTVSKFLSIHLDYRPISTLRTEPARKGTLIWLETLDKGLLDSQATAAPHAHRQI